MIDVCLLLDIDGKESDMFKEVVYFGGSIPDAMGSKC